MMVKIYHVIYINKLKKTFPSDIHTDDWCHEKHPKKCMLHKCSCIFIKNSKNAIVGKFHKTQNRRGNCGGDDIS